MGQISEVGQTDLTYNVFVNETLYHNYVEYFSNVSRLPKGFATSSFTPLQPIDTMVLQSYSCLQRQLKGGVSLLLALITADYPFIVGGLSLVLWVSAVFWQKRKKDANCCQGCSQTNISKDDQKGAVDGEGLEEVPLFEKRAETV